MANDPLMTCEIEPFTSEVVPQPLAEDNSEAMEIFIRQVTNYLQRLREALCDDLQSIVDDLP